MQWDVLRCGGLRWDAVGCGGMRWGAVGCGGIGWDAVGWDMMRWDGMRWDCFYMSCPRTRPVDTEDGDAIAAIGTGIGIEIGEWPSACRPSTTWTRRRRLTRRSVACDERLRGW